MRLLSRTIARSRHRRLICRLAFRGHLADRVPHSLGHQSFVSIFNLYFHLLRYLGAAAIWRANKPRPAAGSYTTRHPAPPSNTPGPLVELCTRRLVDLIGRAVEGGARADIHSTLDRIAAAEGQGHGVLGANYTLRSMAFAWPENLGAELVRRLRTVGLFNSRTALLLRKCVFCFVRHRVSSESKTSGQICVVDQHSSKRRNEN